MILAHLQRKSKSKSKMESSYNFITWAKFSDWLVFVLGGIFILAYKFVSWFFVREYKDIESKRDKKLDDLRKDFEERDRLRDEKSRMRDIKIDNLTQSIKDQSLYFRNTNDTIDINLIRIFNEGPLVSLHGSPTVSPITVAL